MSRAATSNDDRQGNQARRDEEANMSENIPAAAPVRAVTMTHEASEQINEYLKALAEAQKVPLVAAFNRTNPAFKRGNEASKYADLASVAETFAKLLAPQGFSFVQMPTANGADVSVRTLIGHASGQWMASTLAARAQSSNAQQIGAAITYLRRYGLTAMTGIVADDDDDGNTASGVSERDQRKQEREARRGNRQDERGEGNGGRAQPLGPGCFIGADGKTYGPMSGGQWLHEWIERTNKLMQAGDRKGLQAAFDRNREAIAATKAEAPDLAEQVEEAIAKALDPQPANNDNGPAQTGSGQVQAEPPRWLIAHSDTSKPHDPYPGAAEWIAAWRIRTNSVQNSKTPAAKKREKLRAMFTVNEPLLAALDAAGQGAVVADARQLITRLETVLIERERAEAADSMTGAAE